LIELFVERILFGFYGMWSSKKMPLKDVKKKVLKCFVLSENQIGYLNQSTFSHKQF